MTATTHRVRDRADLPTGVGAVALRAGNETVVHVSECLPAATRDAVVGHILQAVHGDPRKFASAAIGFVAALDSIPAQRGVQPIRL